MQPPSQHTFFVPMEFSTHKTTMRSETFNLAHTLLNRTDSDFVFVPIRSMQYLAIIENHDIWFVDSQAYAVKKNVGGRMITISWHTEDESERDSLDENIPMQVIFYDQDMKDIQLRMCGEFYKAMQLMDQRYRDEMIPAEGAEIIPLNQ